MSETVSECLAGRISPSVAIARLVLAGLSAKQIARLLPPGSELALLFARHGEGAEALAGMLRDSAVDHRHGSLDQIRRSFDRAVAICPEASVAAYSLGDAGLLGVATDELVEWLAGEGLLGTARDILDVGCGIGRIAARLAPRARSVIGIDVSDGMIAEAQRRHSAPNLTFRVSNGVLMPVPDGGLDLVLFVDSMPYLVQAGLAEANIREVVRTLRPSGTLAILNLSYQADPDRLAAEWANWSGLTLRHCGTRPFSHWDGTAYVYRKA